MNRCQKTRSLVPFGWMIAIVAAVQSTANADANWPQWRGPNRDGISQEKGLLREWPEGGPKLLWTHREAGKGYSSPSVVGNMLYCLGTNEDQTIAFALDTATGKRLWTTPLDLVYENDRGDGPRSTPTVDGELIFVLTGGGELACVERQSGKLRWRKSLVRDFGGRVPHWGYSESPLVDGKKVVVTPGGSKFLIGLDKQTGTTLLTSSGVSDAAHYASIIKVTVDDLPMYVTMSANGIVGLSADDGKLLWNYEKTRNRTAVIPTPVFVDGRYIYSTSGYGTGWPR